MLWMTLRRARTGGPAAQNRGADHEDVFLPRIEPATPSGIGEDSSLPQLRSPKERVGRITRLAVEEVLPSGKWVQRVPRSLHKKLVSTAKREGVSLNQLVTSVLAAAVGKRQQETSRDATLEMVREVVREEIVSYGAGRKSRGRRRTG